MATLNPQVFRPQSASINRVYAVADQRHRWSCCRQRLHISASGFISPWPPLLSVPRVWAGVWPAVRVQIRSISSVISWSPWHWWKRSEGRLKNYKPTTPDQPTMTRTRRQNRTGGDKFVPMRGSYSRDERKDRVLKAGKISQGRDMKEQGSGGSEQWWRLRCYSVISQDSCVFVCFFIPSSGKRSFKVKCVAQFCFKLG